METKRFKKYHLKQALLSSAVVIAVVVVAASSAAAVHSVIALRIVLAQAHVPNKLHSICHSLLKQS